MEKRIDKIRRLIHESYRINEKSTRITVELEKIKNEMEIEEKYQQDAYAINYDNTTYIGKYGNFEVYVLPKSYEKFENYNYVVDYLTKLNQKYFPESISISQPHIDSLSTTEMRFIFDYNRCKPMAMNEKGYWIVNKYSHLNKPKMMFIKTNGNEPSLIEKYESVSNKNYIRPVVRIPSK